MHLTSPHDLKQKLSLSNSEIHFIEQSRKTVASLFRRQDPRLLLIVGPCSIHNIEEGLAYAKALKQLADEVQDSCFIVMRAYIEKPRTFGGWTGLVNDPHLNSSHDLARGIFLARSFLLNLAKMRMPAGIEFLTPLLAPYLEDLVTWGCIGARTCASQTHRQLASHLPMPVGFKNSVDGNIECAVHGVHVARHSQSFMHIDDLGKVEQVNSVGNPYAHVVLRGSLNGINYDPISIEHTLNTLRRLEIPPRVVVDCSHGNSQGHYFKQKEAFMDTLSQIHAGNPHIFGLMLESNLAAGTQKIPSQLSELQTGVSITDSCLDFSTTQELVKSVASSSSTVMSSTQS